MSSDATTLGQLVILAGLLITALTQIALAMINRRDLVARANALESKVTTTADGLAMKVQQTAADLALQHSRQSRETEAAVRRSNEEVKAELTAAIDKRFDGLVAGKHKVRSE